MSDAAAKASSTPNSGATPVLLEAREGGVLTLLLNRPERLNALNNELTTALNEALNRAAQDSSVRVVVISGAGRAFCAGGDLAEIGKGRQSADTKQLEPLLRFGMQAVLKMRAMPQPVIAAVNGPAAGAGMNVALAADIRIAAEEATFGENFAKVGLFPDFGGTFLLPELAGPSVAAELFYTGEMIDAQRALRCGIVNRVVAGAQLAEQVRVLAQRIADGPPLAVQAVKRTLFAAQRKRIEETLETEVQEQLRCYLSDDCAEGILAFFEKRNPKFQGK